MNHTKSEQIQIEALEHIVGGVNSPSRSYKAVGGGAPSSWNEQKVLIFMM